MNTLKNLLQQLASGSKLLDKNPDCLLIANEIRHLFSKIKSCNTFDESQSYFDSLEQIVLVLERLVYKNKTEVTEELSNFLKDFDRVDDMDLRHHMFTEIKNDRYKL
jgi:hypothetical protein